MASDPTMRTRFVRGFFVGVHTAKNPSNEAWFAHCREVERLRHVTRGALFYTQGGGPNSKQRQELRAALQGLDPPLSAIMTASQVVRGIVIGLNWFFRDPRVAVFAPDDFEGAFAFVSRGDATAPHDEILDALARLAGELGIETPLQAQASRRDPTSASR